MIFVYEDKTLLYLEISVLEALWDVIHWNFSTAEAVQDDITKSADDCVDVIVPTDDCNDVIMLAVDCDDVTAAMAVFKVPVLSGSVINVILLLGSFFNELESAEFVYSITCSHQMHFLKHTISRKEGKNMVKSANNVVLVVGNGCAVYW